MRQCMAARRQYSAVDILRLAWLAACKTLAICVYCMVGLPEIIATVGNAVAVFFLNARAMDTATRRADAENHALDADYDAKTWIDAMCLEASPAGTTL